MKDVIVKPEDLEKLGVKFEDPELAKQVAEAAAKIAKGIAEEVEKEKDETFKTSLSTEKRKLYDTVDHEKARADKATEELKAYKDKESEEQEEIEKQKKATMDSTQRIAELETTIDKSSKLFESTVKTMQASFSNELTKRDLAVLREKLIADAKGQVIPDMVQGNTEEELKASVEVSKARYNEIAETVKKQSTAEGYKGSKLPGPGSEGDPAKRPSGAENSKQTVSWQELMTKDPKEVLELQKRYEDEVFGNGGAGAED